ncbi:hypothetical protein [Massilia haematophila]|uniref:Glycosyltransferase family 1 protein n=1 Tax=Massilia haematophila TaxID=457923 RepID=A0ABV7PM36_9BURK
MVGKYILEWMRGGLRQTARPSSRNFEALSEAIIFSKGESASINYLLRPYLEAKGLRADIVDPESVAPCQLAAAGCRVLIISRYLTKAWIPELFSFKSVGGRIIYFMDDDLMDRSVLIDLPAAYARKIKRLASDHFELLTKLCSEFWVGSPYLAEKYWQWSPTVLDPRPSHAEMRKIEATTVCYHGTASHQGELKWLAPILGEVLTQNAKIALELFGDNAVNKLYRDFPRVSVLHPMNWANYLEYTRVIYRDIGLAPLLSEEFNKGRGPTKFFDYVRMGAVGLYTNVAPYRGFVRHGIDGLLLPNEPGAWKEAISMLAEDKTLRLKMAAAAKERATQMAWGNKY